MITLKLKDTELNGTFFFIVISLVAKRGRYAFV